jgi:hypothetical protein
MRTLLEGVAEGEGDSSAVGETEGDSSGVGERVDAGDSCATAAEGSSGVGVGTGADDSCATAPTANSNEARIGNRQLRQ